MEEFDGRYGVAESFARDPWQRPRFRRPGAGGWSIWQCHDRARIAGVEGGVDLNVAGRPQ